MTLSHAAPVFDVQRFSLHDGPGIRTVVFFKGCTLACAWCQNPEAMGAAPDLAYYEEECIEDCSLCLGVCPEGAIRPQRAARVDFARCTGCGRCAEVCPGLALRTVGRPREAHELLDEVLRDRPFFEASGGGLTLSGGEPVLHSRFLRELLPLAREEALHVAVETSGAYPFALLEPLLPWLDLVLLDVKLVDGDRHERATGRDNEQVLANLRELVRWGVPLEARMPVVPGWNTDAENVRATARLLAGLELGSITLLPYNHLWEAKLPRLGLEHRALGIRPPDDAFYEELRGEFARSGLVARRVGDPVRSCPTGAARDQDQAHCQQAGETERAGWHPADGGPPSQSPGHLRS